MLWQPTITALLVLVGTVGCASDAALVKRVDDMEQELRDLRRSHALTSQRIREIDRLGQTTYLIQDSLEQLSLEIDQVRSRVEELDSRARVVEAALFTERPALPAAQAPAAPRVQPAPAPAPPAGGAGGSARGSARAATPAPAAASPMPDDGDPRSLYQFAYKAMEDDRYETAVEAFGTLLERHPNNDLSDNAHYWLGEIYTELGDVQQAETHFRTILDRYPAGNKVPDALYKLGALAQQAGDCQTAATWYGKVTEQYPWSPVSEKATTRMQECSQ